MEQRARARPSAIPTKEIYDPTVLDDLVVPL
jgi:hypothetical protein